MTRPVANLRLFAAVYPPAHLAERWRSALALRNLPAYKLVPVHQVHLTLQFIGDTPANALDDVIESIERSASGLRRFDLAAERVIVLPERGPARLVAVETTAHPTLLELQRRLAVRLARNVREHPGRGFRPHMTICRFRSPSRVRLVDEAIARESFAVDGIRLMRSTLHPEGAEHIEIAAIALD
jgi:RNA 2',3'-cyclic 3'-phosphodiesterase